MQQPSQKSLLLAEEILDHVRYGLTRCDVLKEWAEIIDEGNADLVAAATRLLHLTEGIGKQPAEACRAELRAILADYQSRTPAPITHLVGIG